ncbi:MAG: PQQ-binding-like beta-propeller repeat protein [Cyclobacteriaceae bacterium]|nr:PQQ-binding-like beta-propeller repeat protein [Cyclobacteriaceae bacterium]
MDYFSLRTSLLICLLITFNVVGLCQSQGTDTLSRATFITAHSPDTVDLGRAPWFGERHSSVEGITTFRGSPFRDSPSTGTIPANPSRIRVRWTFSTGFDKSWAGGAGWTGQPAVIQWPDSTRRSMNLSPSMRDKQDFVEVVAASLDGKIYFLDLATGKPSRPPINTQHPIKGSVSVDPRGWPLLYSGQGISNDGTFAFRIFNLLDQQLIFKINGHDPFARRNWGAFDGSPLIDPVNDVLYEAGENGLLYKVRLRTKWRSSSRSLTVQPLIQKYRYERKGGSMQGVENSLAAWHDRLFFADNNGYLQCYNTSTRKTEWWLHNYDDTDATLTLQEDAGVPFLYTGNEVDLQGDKGLVHLRKINGLTGAVVWDRTYPCYSVRGAHPVNGGMLSTPAMGKNNDSDIVIFSLSRYGGLSRGLLVALRKSDGTSVWESPLPYYAWSSPLDLYDPLGNMFVFLADSHGQVMLFNGRNGELITKEKIANLFEASPVGFGNQIVIPSRPRDIFCLEIE